MEVEMTLHNYLHESVRLLASATRSWTEQLVADISTMGSALGPGEPLLVCGNGGSACDAMHNSGELVDRFILGRRALNVICLSSNPAVLTPWATDYSYDTVFCRQTEPYGQAGGVILGISNSGTSKNVIAAFEQARSMGMQTIALPGEGGQLAHSIVGPRVVPVSA
jgi:D-sedoheptulose 7-phosphate isomerase